MLKNMHVQALAFHALHSHSAYVQSRPFGVALLVAGKEGDGYVLYHADPSGTYVRYEAKAIGSGSEGAQGLLQEKYSKDLSLQDALTLAVTVLKQVYVLLHRPC